MEEIVLFGHHTGAQDILFYMQNGQYVSKVSHVIFEGGLRNPYVDVRITTRCSFLRPVIFGCPGA